MNFQGKARTQRYESAAETIFPTSSEAFMPPNSEAGTIRTYVFYEIRVTVTA
jgi:hypothetical protein